MLRYLVIHLLLGNLVWLGLTLFLSGVYILERVDSSRWKVAAWPLIGIGALVTAASIFGYPGKIVSGTLLLLLPVLILTFATRRDSK